MKDLSSTFGASNIQKYQQKTTTIPTTKKTTGNFDTKNIIPTFGFYIIQFKAPSTEIIKIVKVNINMKDLNQPIPLANINSFYLS